MSAFEVDYLKSYFLYFESDYSDDLRERGFFKDGSRRWYLVFWSAGMVIRYRTPFSTVLNTKAEP
jgi:hypothetical protein